MQRVNNYSFYTLGAFLHPVTQISPDVETLGDVFWVLSGAREWIDYLLEGRLGVPITFARPTAIALRIAMNSLIPLVGEQDKWSTLNMKRLVDYRDDGILEIVTKAKELETLLSMELQNADTYYVVQKGIWATALLIDSADHLLNKPMRDKLPDQALNDLKQAGRCLALECPTAAGFHVLRSVEAVLRNYYEIIAGTKPKIKVRNWGAYIKLLRMPTHNPEMKVLGILDQIRDLHRNPLAHPEENLSSEDATVLVGIAVSAIVAMVIDIDRRTTAGTEASFGMSLN